MRVIAGQAGGIRLLVPKSATRPTMDRVKAAIFSSLGELVIASRVLDLFAGSGALGIEALSRGAANAVFVDEDRQSATTIEKNLAKAHVDGRIYQENVFNFLRRPPPAKKYRIIFADPPYEKMQSGDSFTDKLLEDKALPWWLEPEGIFVLEKRPGEDMPPMKSWRLLRQKTYGATEVLFLSSTVE